MAAKSSAASLVAVGRGSAYLEAMASPVQPDASMLIREWTLPAAATLGSSVRSKGLLLELRARLPFPRRKWLELRGPTLVLQAPEAEAERFASMAAIVDAGMETIESVPVIPREIEDILSISTTERHRWLKDGRLRSAGTRTVKLRGRAKKITFHVFDPRQVEEALDSDLVASWREDDVLRKAENRRRARETARLKRLPKAPARPLPEGEDSARFALEGWAEFERNGPLL